jgi:hypothetical protein
MPGKKKLIVTQQCGGNQSGIEREISLVLSTFGWKPLKGESALAVKSFDTIVGVRDAHVYLSPCDKYSRTLSGYFLSEGKNALASCLVNIPNDASSVAIHQLSCKFVMQAKNDIAAAFSNPVERVVVLQAKRRAVYLVESPVEIEVPRMKV